MADQPRRLWRPILLLRALGMLAAGTLVVPLVYALFALLHVELPPTPKPWVVAAIALLVGAVQFLWRPLGTRALGAEAKPGRRLLLRLLELVLGLALTGGSVLLISRIVPSPKVLLLVLQAIASLVAWIIMGASSRKVYHLSFSDRHLLAAIILTLASYIFAGLLKVPLTETHLLLVFALQVTAWLLLRNQSNIDHQMARGHHQASDLPRHIRSQNLRWTLLIAALFFLAILFRDPLAQVVRSFFDALLGLIRSLMQGLSSGEDPVVVPEETQIMDRTPDFVQRGDAKGSPWWNLLYVVAGGFVIALIVTYRRGIFEAFVSMGRAILRFFRRIFGWKLSQESRVDEALGDYLDVTENLKRESFRERRRRRQMERHPDRFLRKEAQRTARAIRERTRTEARWSREDVRTAYQLVMRHLDLQAPLPESATTRSIYQAHRSELEALGLGSEAWTTLYEHARYDQPEPSIPVDASLAETVLEALQRLGSHR